MIPRPMKPQWFHILLALSDGDLHGFGIQTHIWQPIDSVFRQITAVPTAPESVP